MEVQWIILLCVTGVVCIAGEVYLPGGIIGSIGALLFIWSVVEAFKYSTNFGTMLLICGLGGAISCSWFSFTYLSKTKEGRKALLMDSEIELPKDRHTGLEKKEGVAVTDLRPGGVVKIEDRRLDASTQGEYIEKGSKVIVFKIEADCIYVKEFTEEKEET